MTLFVKREVQGGVDSVRLRRAQSSRSGSSVDRDRRDGPGPIAPGCNGCPAMARKTRLHR